MTAQSASTQTLHSAGPGMGGSTGLGWLSIVRLGLVQASLGSIVVLTTSVLNRVMVVELMLAAVIPGLLVGLHYGVQISRPLWGHGSDRGGRRTPWIVGGILLLALAGTAASATTLLFGAHFWLAMGLAIVSFICIGLGIGAAGTSLLALLASRTVLHRKPAAATIVWMMMIAGIVVTAIISGAWLDPFSFERLIAVTAIAGLIAFLLTCLAIFNVERNTMPVDGPPAAQRLDFRQSLAATWGDRDARLFTVFVFVSMLAYATQDLILEPFGGLLFGLTPGETTQISGLQHSGILLGMAMVGVLGSLFAKKKPLILKAFIFFGCVGSAVALAGLSLSALVAPLWPLKANIFVLGVANGAFAVAAIGAMMMLASGGDGASEGIRMGVWGAAQAISFGLGGFLGTVAIDVTRALTHDTPLSFAVVFGLEAGLFLAAAAIALLIKTPAPEPDSRQPTRRNTQRGPEPAPSYAVPAE
ncbi:PUCC protein [Hoeflea phototrophica DFL-43]|uniref:PUCC protein n=1 Tax=Hoeflea phototrophica (strain DSM 17068 / NCIMB 14078 / DFL-43) TaxID=411684 RepID=A9DAC1_HOEPD|nr:BCD family MFS transporter [Hoeflea phototrophica]EDQ32703.1 PUCC protein [Hoeflea phototrophica DFL-43]